jgi:hypothetical protein
MAETGWDDGTILERGIFKVGRCRERICSVAVGYTPERDVVDLKAGSLTVRHVAHGIGRDFIFEYTRQDCESCRVLDLLADAVRAAFREHHEEMFPTSKTVELTLRLSTEWPVS